MGQQTLSKGDKAPKFKLKDQNDQWVDIADYLGKHTLVVYFYPKDDTPGCTAEACTFRDSFEAFEQYGAKVIGISSDSPASHKQFAAKYNLNFTLLSDPNRKVEKLFGVPSNLFGLLPGRVTFVIDKSGTVQLVFNSQFNAKQHIAEALAQVKLLS